MKQISISEVIDAFGDEPASIGDRLKGLGVGDDVLSKFSSELLKSQVYASSFVKFLQDNKSKISIDNFIDPIGSVGELQNPFVDKVKTISQRLTDLGLSDDEKSKMFQKDILDLGTTGQEFTSFVKDHEVKFNEKIDERILAEE